MKTNKFLLLFAVGILTFAGCTTTPTTVNTGTIHARTFSFVKQRANLTSVYADNNENIHRMIQDAITKNLASRGVGRVSANGDIAVPYLLIVGNNVSTKAINEYFGYSGDVTALHAKAHEAYTGTNNPNHFDAGTLIIDITDGRNFKLLKRGYATRAIASDLSAGARAERIQKAVDTILRDLKISQ